MFVSSCVSVHDDLQRRTLSLIMFTASRVNALCHLPTAIASWQDMVCPEFRFQGRMVFLRRQDRCHDKYFLGLSKQECF